MIEYRTRSYVYRFGRWVEAYWTVTLRDYAIVEWVVPTDPGNLPMDPDTIRAWAAALDATPPLPQI